MADSRTLLSLLFPLFLLFVIPEVFSEVCAPPNKDVKVLKAQRYWQFEVSDNFPGSCKRFFPPVENYSSTCIFYFSICTPVPDFCPENSGICLANKVDFLGTTPPETLYTKPINIGSFKEGKDPFTAEPTYFDVLFEFGEKIVLPKSPFPAPTITKIRFRCNENATWEASKDGKVPQIAHVNVTNTTGDNIVMYNIEFEYKGACPRGGGGGSSEEPSKPLSVGSILLILFFPGMFLYCVVGALINRGAGKTGKEMIPNSKFWTELPGLISDGFSFVVAKITCSEMSTSRETYDQM